MPKAFWFGIVPLLIFSMLNQLWQLASFLGIDEGPKSPKPPALRRKRYPLRLMKAAYAVGWSVVIADLSGVGMASFGDIVRVVNIFRVGDTA